MSDKPDELIKRALEARSMAIETLVDTAIDTIKDLQWEHDEIIKLCDAASIIDPESPVVKVNDIYDVLFVGRRKN